MGETLFESCKRWGESIPQIWNAITERGWTLVHGDLWINNLLFNPNQDIPPLYGENRVALVDWQTCCKVILTFTPLFTTPYLVLPGY